MKSLRIFSSFLSYILDHFAKPGYARGVPGCMWGRCTRACVWSLLIGERRRCAAGRTCICSRACTRLRSAGHHQATHHCRHTPITLPAETRFLILLPTLFEFPIFCPAPPPPPFHTLCPIVAIIWYIEIENFHSSYKIRNIETITYPILACIGYWCTGVFSSHKQTILHPEESSIWRIAWQTQGHVLAWASEHGVHIYDFQLRRRVGFLPRDKSELGGCSESLSDAAASCSLVWKDAVTLLIASATVIKVCSPRWFTDSSHTPTPLC